MRNIVANRMAKNGLCFSSENYQLVRKIVIKGHYSGCFTIFFLRSIILEHLLMVSTKFPRSFLSITTAVYV